MNMHTSTNGYTIMPKKKAKNLGSRQQMIVEHINQHHGEITEKVFKALNSHMARSTFFKELHQLIKARQIRVEEVNRRDRRLYPYHTLLISAPKELDAFIKNFKRLLDSVQEYVRKKAALSGCTISQLPENYVYQIIGPAIHIFIEITNLYSYYALLIWPKHIKETEVLSRLYFLVFDRINLIRKDLLDTYKLVLPHSIDEIDSFVPLYTWEPKHIQGNGLLSLYRHYNKMGLRRKFEPVMKDLEQMSVNYSRYISKINRTS